MLDHVHSTIDKNSSLPHAHAPFGLPPLLFIRAALAIVTLLSCAVHATARPPQLAPTPPAPATPQLRDVATREGPFTVGDQQYFVRFQYKVLPERPGSTSAANPSSTLWRFDVLGAHETLIYHQTFRYDVTQGRFQENLSASASLMHGEGGTLLVIRFLDHPIREPGDSSHIAKESWQLFSIVNGQFTPLGPLLPLGHGENIAVGGVVAAVMTKGGIAVMPVASTAEVLALQAWTGNFYVSVPLRFDWAHAQWGVGEQCYLTADGNLTERGCILPVQASPQPRSPDVDFPNVQLFAAPDGNTDEMQNVLITTSTHIAILETQVIVRWHSEGAAGLAQRVACTFNDVWLRVRLDEKEGWVHGQDAFAALGLPLSDPIEAAAPTQ